MIAGVANTHAALWYLLKNSRLSATARDFMDEAARAGRDIALSPISLTEILYLVEKERLPWSAYEELKAALADPDCVIKEAPFTAAWLTRCAKYRATRSLTCPIASSPRPPCSCGFRS